ncbi:helix-turn-helix transcriptional regulator [Kineobactrum salinum]|uniref:AAA family ATPase n=1 Tax=Kineobactrum salinum TaxID=2708301 RepID=A0A6C0U214_9GAMM|nr:LuxR C-terminal-related transcriptional regulator [Kineobactrum salinum]QIB65519.1 AAA family ATPase [Kineobactrum salinum]
MLHPMRGAAIGSGQASPTWTGGTQDWLNSGSCMTKTKPPDIAIVRTKLAPPRIGSAPVNRNELLQRLNSNRNCKLNLVLGPAGCGKTMLLAQWRRQLSEQGAKVAWYNLGMDDDVTQVGAYIVESLRSAELDIHADALQFFNRSGGKSRSSFLASLVDDLIDCNEEVYLIIDDFHYSTAFNIFQLMDAFLDALPDNVHLVIGSRSRPPLNLLKLRTQDQLAELDFKDLRFDVYETGRFVAAQGLSSLDPAHIRRLYELSDGWAAGLQLLLFALRKESQVDHFFERHTSKASVSQEGALVSYLESTVADYISAEELDFLASISVCRRFNRVLCEELSGNSNAGELLKKFEDEQLFLLPIDTPDIDPWYRFHRLFESFLHSRLEQRDKADIRTLYQKAARWFAEQRLDIEALRYASEAGDNELMAELIERSARRLTREGYFRQLIKWCDQIPKETLRERLGISLNLAWAQISCGHLDAFQENLESILLHPNHRAASVHYEVQLLCAYGRAAVDDTAGIIQIVEPMLQAAQSTDAFLLSLISNLASTGYVYSGRFAEAREAVRVFYRKLPSGQTQHKHLLADWMIGNSYLAEGRIRDALAHQMPFKDKIVLRGKVGPDTLGNVIGPLCEALFQFNLLDDARELIETYAEIIGAAELPDGILSGYRVRAHLELLAGDSQAAFQTMQHLEEIGIRRRLDRLVAWSLYDQFALSVHFQHLTSREEILYRLSQLAEQYADCQYCSWAEIPMISALATAENALHHDVDYLECMHLIGVAEEHCQRLGRHGTLIGLGFMRCIASLGAGRQKPALGEASKLLKEAAELGALRVLADIGLIAHPLAKLLVSRAHSDSEHELLEIALGSSTAANDNASIPPTNAEALTEPLTAREQDVLELLGKGLSAKGIGRGLNISPTTAKWHLKNVYGKLGASSREDALAKARQHRIIS